MGRWMGAAAGAPTIVFPLFFEVLSELFPSLLAYLRLQHHGNEHKAIHANWQNGQLKQLIYLASLNQIEGFDRFEVLQVSWTAILHSHRERLLSFSAWR